MDCVREPAVAGLFYYLNKELLRKQIERFFQKAKEKGIKPENRLVVSPHAGYEYSGQTAAYALSSLSPKNKFIIFGPNHTGLGSEFSIMSKGLWRMPLGDVKIDSELADKIKECDLIEEDEFAHLKEHSIEVQLPFLQVLFKEFSFVPVCIMNIGYSKGFFSFCKSIGKHVAELIKEDEKIGVIASSDFSHFIPSNEAEEIDIKAIKKIEKLDTEGFFDFIRENKASICGYGPILITMFTARFLGIKKAKLIYYTNSGETTHDYSSVVGYAAIGFK